MGAYLQNYGAGEDRRNRVVKFLILGVLTAVVLAIVAYFFFHNRSEEKTVEHFLAQVNAHDYKDAYVTWGCTEASPCRNYDFGRFLEDWGPKTKATSPWKIASVEGCRSFVTVNVKADGAELQSLGVERGARTVSYAPSPECQERKWHWKQFFQRIFNHSSS
jgi:hypothetical protein